MTDQQAFEQAELDHVPGSVPSPAIHRAPAKRVPHRSADRHGEGSVARSLPARLAPDGDRRRAFPGSRESFGDETEVLFGRDVAVDHHQSLGRLVVAAVEVEQSG